MANDKSRGFTIIELVIALGLFATIITIVSASFISGLRSQKALLGLMTANDNASLILEQMAREIRLGSNFSSPTFDEISFVNAYGQNISYRLNPASASLERGVDTASFNPITSSNVLVKRLSFILSGQNSSDGLQPKITILMSVASKERKLQDVTVDVQTTVSARSLES